MNSPQFLYMILVLPGLFGIALLGEGLNKLMQKERVGLVWIFIGLLFIGLVIFLASFSQIV